MLEIKDTIKLGKNQDCFIKHQNPTDESEPVSRYFLAGACRHTGNNATPTGLRSGKKKQTVPTGHWITYLKYATNWFEWNDAHPIDEHVPSADVGKSEIFLFMHQDCFPKEK